MIACATPERPVRRLAAVLAADVAGYSRLMGRDELATLREIKAQRAEVRPLLRRFGGSLIDTAGDAFLAEFESAVHAVECAVAIQQALARRTADVPPEQRMLHRIGISLGEVLHARDSIYGDSVNLAARVQAESEPGGLCLAGDAHDQVSSRLGYGFADLGEKTLKNMARPVHLFALGPDAIAQLPPPQSEREAPRIRLRPAAATLIVLLAIGIAGLGAWQWSRRADDRMARAAADRPSIAILPFITLGGDAENGYFGDGLAEDLIAALGRFPELSVLSRNAVFPYKGTTLPPEQIGRELGARYISQGSVRRSADRLRVTMQLVDTSNGKLLWSERYDEAPREVFAVQDDIVRHVANALFIKVWKIEAAQATAKPPGNLEAYDLTLRGSSLYLKFTRLTNAQARSFFEQALQLDATYPPAMIGLGWVDVLTSDQGWTEDRVAALARAEALARRAIAINGEDANAHALLGTVLVRQGHATQATEELRTAIGLNPSSSDSYASLGDVLLWSGDPQGSSEAMELALKLNPNLDTGILVSLGLAYFLIGRSSDALAVTERAVARDPRIPVAHEMLAAIYMEKGDTVRAQKERTTARVINPLFNTRNFVEQFPNAENRRRLDDALRKAGF